MTREFTPKFRCLLFALALGLTFAGKVAAQVKPAFGDKPRKSAPAADYTLIDQDGKPFDFAQVRGQIAFVFFGYTTCPDACPTTLAKLSRVFHTLGAQADQVVVIFVSLDPDRDSPIVLKEYLGYFRMKSRGITGTRERIDALVRTYGAKYEIESSDSAAGYHINHSTDLYLLNQEGSVARRFSYDERVQVIAAEARRLIHGLTP